MSHNIELALGQVQFAQLIAEESARLGQFSRGVRWLTRDLEEESLSVEWHIQERRVRLTIGEDDLADLPATPALQHRLRLSIRSAIRSSQLA